MKGTITLSIQICCVIAMLWFGFGEMNSSFTKIEKLVTPKQFVQLYDTIKVSATVYYAEANQTDSTPNITASGYHITGKDDEHICAVSWDLIKWYCNFGDTIIIQGAGYYDGKWRVEDLTAKRHSRLIDFCVARGNSGFFRDVKLLIKKR